MFQINQITSDYVQQQNITLPDGSIFSYTMNYSIPQAGWFFTNITYGTFILNGTRICVSEDLLYQFKNNLPFGISCVTTTGREPTQLQDFSSGNFQLFVLSETDVTAIATALQS